MAQLKILVLLVLKETFADALYEERGCIGSCWGNLREGDNWGDVGVDGWIILGWI